MTRTLRTDLRALGGTTNPGLLAPPAAVRARGDRRRRRTTAMVAAVGVLGCSALVVALTTRDTSEEVIQPADPVSTPSSTPSASLRGDKSPHQSIAGAGHRFDAHAIAALDGRFVVVGDSSDLDGVSGPSVYWSDDGARWHPPAEGEGPDSVNVTDVIATGQGFLAVGISRDGPGAWRSVDGRTWVESEVSASPGGPVDGLWGITDTRLGYYAWGLDGGSAHLWRSADGTAWEQVVDESVFDLPRRETICAVEEADGGLRASGVTAPAGTRDGRRVAWTSTDGESWVLTEDSGEPVIWCDPTEYPGHWEARTDAGVVRIEPNGNGDLATLEPATD